jgi:hypothetical protein
MTRETHVLNSMDSGDTRSKIRGLKLFEKVKEIFLTFLRHVFLTIISGETYAGDFPRMPLACERLSCLIDLLFEDQDHVLYGSQMTSVYMTRCFQWESCYEFDRYATISLPLLHWNASN